MSCRTCPHGPAPCGHPLVMPFEGEPPSELGSRVVDWLAEHARVERGRAVVPDGVVGCPGADERRAGR